MIAAAVATDPRVAAARDLIARGYQVVPLQGKRPFRRDWPSNPLAADDAHEGNIGVLLTNSQRLICVDVDCKNGAPGLATLEDWRLLVPDFDRAPDQITPSGGQHYLLRVPDGVDINGLPNGNAAPGIDVLRDRRQFVVAPSFSEQGAYVGSLPATPTDAPLMSVALIELMRVERSSTERVEPDVAPSVERVREAVARIPNAGDTSRDAWVQMALFIKGAVGPEHDADGLDIFQEWAAAWPGNDPTENERVYASGNPKGGWHALVKHACMEADEALAAFGAVPVEAPAEPEFTLYSPDDLARLPDPEWLVEDVFSEDSWAVMYAAPGAGKSFAALYLAVCIAEGVPFFGKKVKQGPVAIVVLEGFAFYKRRVAALLKVLGVKGDNLRIINGYEVGAGPFLLHEARPMTALVRALRRNNDGRWAFVIVDTVARATTGLEENSNSDEARIATAVAAIRQATGAAVLGVHHSGWDDTRMRGASARKSAVDVVLKLSREGEQCTLELEKVRDGASGLKWPARLAPVGGDTVPVFLPSAATEAFSADDRQWQILQELSYSAPEGLTTKQLQAQCSGSPRSHQRDRAALRDKEWIAFRGNRWRITDAGKEALEDHNRDAIEDLTGAECPAPAAPGPADGGPSDGDSEGDFGGDGGGDGR